MNTKLLAGAALVLGAVGVAAPASADSPTQPPTPTPHPAAGGNHSFRGLDCAPSQKRQKGMPSLNPQQRTQEIQRGISDGIRGPLAGTSLFG
jgi:hypothetical protein